MKNKINIFGIEYKIEKRERIVTNEGVCHGLIDFETQIIYLDETLSKEEFQQTLLHEAFHGVVKRLGLNQSIAHEVEEVLVDSFATFLIENFHLRPRF